MKENKRRILYLIALPIVMFGFGFLLVPLYTVFCKITGLNGKIFNSSVVASESIDVHRTLEVRFLSHINGRLAFDFYCLQPVIYIRPGENTIVAFRAKNLLNQPAIVQTIPSVVPGLMAKYIRKTECFCFTQQYFKPNETRIMPILFHLDVDVPKNVQQISLCYTMFDIRCGVRKRPDADHIFGGA